MPNFAPLADDLSELFGQTVTVEGGEQRQLGGATLSIVQMRYRQQSHDGNSSTLVRQSVIVSKDPELDLPRFSLWPTHKGISGKLISMLAGEMGDIDFPDSPKFSEEYHLLGWSEKPTRLLFNRAIRDHFSKNLGWCVNARSDLIAIFRGNEVISEADHPWFVEDGLKILSLLQQGEEHLDTMPEVSRETTANDLADTAQRMGLAGSMLIRQLKKFALTGKDLDEFLEQVPPREIPHGMKRQVLGNNLVLVFVGSLFAIMGSVLGGGFVLAGDGNERWFGLLFVLMFPLIGCTMVFFTLRYRNRKKRTLKRGTLVQATVTAIARTSTSINDQRKYEVSVEYSHDGRDQTGTLAAYGHSVDRARKFHSDNKPMRVLIDPSDPTHLVGIDLLILFEEP